MKVTDDTHVNPAEGKEVLPWFYVEVMFDPHDIRGYILGGYWLLQMGRYEDSMKFLMEGKKNNPNSAEILTSIGEVYYRRNEFDEARSYLARACQLWLEGKPPNVPSNQYMTGDRFLAFDLLGSLYERKGFYEDAIKIYDMIYRIDKNPAIFEKIKRVQGMRTGAAH